MPVIMWLKENDTGMYRIWPSMAHWPNDVFERITKQEFDSLAKLRFITLLEYEDDDYEKAQR